MHKLSIVIPVFNERKTIEEIIRQVQVAKLPDIEKEIIVVDDGSTDGTREAVAQIANIRYFFHDQNLGKGGAIKTGFKNATGDLLIIQDADLEYDPSDYWAMVEPLLNKKDRITLGMRINPKHDERKKKSHYWLAWFGNKLITWTTNWLFWNDAKDYEGCYKVFPADLIKNTQVFTNDFDYDNELICKLLKKGYKTIDVPIHYHPRGYNSGKKIKWHHGFKILKTIIKTRFE